MSANTRFPVPAGAPRGFGLIEIMLAMALGLVVVGALGQLYSGSMQSQRVSHTLGQINENGRFLVDFLSNDLRMAGYLSCGGSSAQIGNSVNGNGHWLYSTGGIEGFEGGTDTPPAEFTGLVRAGTDMLVVRRAAIDLDRKLVQDYSGSATMQIGLDHGFAVGEILVISDPSCTQASLFQVTGLTNVGNPGDSSFDAVEHSANENLGPGNCTNSLHGRFDCGAPQNAEVGQQFRPGSAISRYWVSAYYVTASDPPTLARKRLGHGAGQAAVVDEEMIRGVEDFQIQYGLDTDGDPARIVDTYVTADMVADWSQVVSVRFALLLRSKDQGARAEAQTQTFELAGRVVQSPTDRYLRRSFGNVVALRNNLQ